MSPYIHGGGHFEFYARWPPEIDHNLFAMVFETLMPIPNTVPNLKNLAPSARFDLILVYSSPANLIFFWSEVVSAEVQQRMGRIRTMARVRNRNGIPIEREGRRNDVIGGGFPRCLLTSWRSRYSISGTAIRTTRINPSRTSVTGARRTRTN